MAHFIRDCGNDARRQAAAPAGDGLRSFVIALPAVLGSQIDKAGEAQDNQRCIVDYAIMKA